MVQLTVAGQPLKMRVAAPTGPIAHALLLPLYRALVDQIMALTVKAAAQKGELLSCHRGCAACCRQLVAVSALEARELMKLVDRMAEPQRSRVRQRFADARARLRREAPDMFRTLLHPHEFPQTDQQSQAMARQYLRLWIDCPFLEDEACAVYADRPVSCRQFAGYSAPEHCTTMNDLVRPVNPPGGHASRWMPVQERTRSGHPADVVALVVAPDFIAEHPDEPPPRPGVNLLHEFLTRMQQQGGWTRRE
jgi:Fe-S-cluster containining protein